MKENQIKSLLLEKPVDIFYLTGLWFSKARLLCREKMILIVDGRYIAAAQKNFHFGEVLLASGDVFKKLFEPLSEVSLDGSFTTLEILSFWEKQAPHITWKPVADPLKTLRVVKDSSEIKALQKAADVTKKGYHQIVSLLKEGVSEGELALEFEFFCRKAGASRLSFDPIIAFGENSAYPHYRASNLVHLKNNQIVLIDIGAVVDDYAADMTRTVFFGKPDPELKLLQKLVIEAQHQAMKLVRPGVCLGTLDEAARNVFQRAEVEALFTHNLGHGVGLEIHEFPSLRFDGPDRNLILEEGMVFTIEPGLYQPGLGGIRWEDTIVVTKTGYESFYAGL
jgi:Xaa-Pro aminopeptidase